MPDLCKAYTPGKSEQDVNARLSRLEHIVDVTLPQILGQSLSSPSSPGATNPFQSRFGGSRSTSPDEYGSQGEENDEANGTFDGGGKWYGKSVSGSVAPNSVLEQVGIRLALHFVEPYLCIFIAESRWAYQQWGSRPTFAVPRR